MAFDALRVFALAGAWSIGICGAAPIVTSAEPHKGERSIVIPQLSKQPKRAITTIDLATLRDIDVLSAAPDGKRYAILVRQADPTANAYRTAWFIGSTTSNGLVYAGDGGEVRFKALPSGRTTGSLGGGASAWSADSAWFAYTLKRGGEVQLWRSRADGAFQEQLTRNAADVRDIAWSVDGKKLFFTVGAARALLRARENQDRRDGINLQDFQWFDEIVHDATPARLPEKNLTVWVFDFGVRRERHADASEVRAFNQIRDRSPASIIPGALDRPIERGDGALLWLDRVSNSDKAILPFARLTASFRRDGGDPIACAAEVCTAQSFMRTWWSADGARVIFWQKEDGKALQDRLYTWSPLTGMVSPLRLVSDENLGACDLATTRIVCIRDTPMQPPHVVAIDTMNGNLNVLANVNPEYLNIRLGVVERVEWRLGPDLAGLGYPREAYGYVIFPPDFDPAKRYPLIIAPYSAAGFKRGDVGDEHPLLVYAANGFVVLNTNFPSPLGAMAQEAVGPLMSRLFSATENFPDMTMQLDSTVRALDAVWARGYVDPAKVGIGGISQATIISLFMLQKHERLAAVSVSGAGWSQATYYRLTRSGRAIGAGQGIDDWPESSAYWSRIDIADHVDAVEAPILFQIADRESFIGFPRLQRRLDDGGKVFDAYIFPDEYHIKWQPTHRLAIYNRNIDWMNFWLQGREDADPAKAAQYERWRAMRVKQCELFKGADAPWYCRP